MSLRKVGLTGARGVLGQRLYETLRRDASLEVDCYDGDILDQTAIEEWATIFQPETVFNLAAVVPIAVVERNRSRSREVNAEGPSVLLKGILNANDYRSIRFVQVSTCHIYGSNSGPISETSPASPQNFYGQTKLEGEIGLQYVAEATQGVDLVIARVFGVYSENQHSSFLYPSLLRKIRPELSRQKIDLPGANNVRDFLHASQVAELLAELGRSKESGVVNIGSGQGATVKMFAESKFGVQLELYSGNIDRVPTSLIADVTRLKGAIGESRFGTIVAQEASLE